MKICELDRISIQYDECGEGYPVVLLHGWSMGHGPTKKNLEPIFQGRPGWRRIYPDMPGHGLTPGADWIKNQDDMLDILIEFIDKIVGDRKFSLVGVSYGAYLARGVIHRRVEQVHGLMMVVPLIVAPDDNRDRPGHVTLVEDQSVLSELREGEEWVTEMAVVQSKQFLDRARALYAAESPGDTDFQERMRQPVNYAYSFDVDDVGELFPGPTLMIAGRQDAIVGYRDAFSILENYPRASYVVLDMGGHLVSLEQPEIFRHLTVEWLDRVERFRASGQMG